MSSPNQGSSSDTPSSRNVDGSQSNGEGSSSNPVPTSTSSTDEPSAPAAETPTTDRPPPPGEQPRMPWNGPIPSFFVMGPGGALLPHFLPRPPGHVHVPQPQSPSPQPQQQAQQPQQPQQPHPHHPHPIHFNPFGNAFGPFGPTSFPIPGTNPHPAPGPFFSIFMPQPLNQQRRPDPEAAAELLRSLPTVSKGLFRRVQRVIMAEQEIDGEEGAEDENEKGWKCGICLEGVEEDSKETGVKALPCNHLFHGDCLEPWFTTNHTCPTCRLELDPGRTLPNNTRPGFRRPEATGSGRQSPHPYNRPQSQTPTPVAANTQTTNASAQTSEQAETTTENDANIVEEERGGGITFFWRMPVPPPAGPNNQSGASNANGNNSTSAPASAEGDGSAGDVAPTAAPDTPTISFDLPFTASPAAATTGRPSPSPEPNMSTDQAPAMPDGRPQPERRTHFAVIHHHLPPPGHHLPSPGHHHHILPTSPHHHHHFHHHHHLRPPGQSTPAPQSGTPPPAAESSTGIPADSASTSTTPTPAPQQPLSPGVGANENDTDTAGATQTTDDTSSDAQNQTQNGDQPQNGNQPQNDNQPHFHFFFNFTDGPPPFMPPMPPFHTQTLPAQNEQRPAAESGRPAEPTQAAQPPAPPIERPTLTQWVEERERRLGWRCDAPDCGIAPTDEDEDEPMILEGDREMISIYSGLQPPLPPNSDDIHEDASGGSAGKDGNMSAGFEIHACPHRWHRTCLESVELSSGRPMRVDEEGRCWVRCERCRTDGWVRKRTRTMSESEVEKLIMS